MSSNSLFDRKDLRRGAKPLSVLTIAVLAASVSASAQLNTGNPQVLSTGQTITPLAPRESRYQQLNPGVPSDPGYTVGQAVSTVVSPDHKTLLALTSGYNLETFTSGANAGATNPAASTEWIFVFDITGSIPVQKQAISVPNTYSGIAFSPNGKEFYVSGGDDDVLHIYAIAAGKWAESGTGIALGHKRGLGLQTPPEAAGVAVTANGQKLVVADYENDAISVLTRADGAWSKTAELDLRPGVIDPSATGVPGGEFPFWVAIKGNNTAYISSIRDREIVVVNLQGGAPAVSARIKLPGQPNKMVLKADGSKLYVAQDNSDSVAVIDTASGLVEDEIKVTAPVAIYENRNGFRGANPNGLALSPDEKTLYVTNGGENAVAVVRLSGVAGNSAVEGLIPTGWYPNSISTSGDGKFLYIVNGKSAAGPNPLNCEGSAKIKVEGCGLGNQYIFQLTKAGFQSLPTPAAGELSRLTDRVVKNNHWTGELTAQQRETMAALHNKIKHVIYIIKENRTYDQVLGDLEVGNGDPTLTQFPEANTPNFHRIARNFVDFDNFYDTSDVSGDGWPWSTSARSTDVIEKEIPPNYAGRGLDNDSEGTNRNVNVAYVDPVVRYTQNPLDGKDPNSLPGNANVAAPDADEEQGEGQGEGYLWNGALRAGLTVRDYGFFLDISRYNLGAPYANISIPELPNPAATRTQVAYSSNTVLVKYTDKYFRGFDQTFPDYYRFQEWNREFQQYVQSGNLPNLELVRLPHDHFGNFSIALDKVNTPELQIADNDYAVGMVADAVAHSRYRDDTLIFVIEDDAQDGGDHVDAHRSNAYVIGPYVKHNFVDSRRYNTVSMLRTIEDILGIKHLNLNDDSAEPMANAFNPQQRKWNFKATPSSYLKQTTLPIQYTAQENAEATLKPLHDAAWWAEQSKGMDFSVEDHLDTPKFNRVLWQGTMGEIPYPTLRNGLDLRANRQQLLEHRRHTDAAQSPVSGGMGTTPGSAD